MASLLVVAANPVVTIVQSGAVGRSGPRAIASFVRGVAARDRFGGGAGGAAGWQPRIGWREKNSPARSPSRQPYGDDPPLGGAGSG